MLLWTAVEASEKLGCPRKSPPPTPSSDADAALPKTAEVLRGNVGEWGAGVGGVGKGRWKRGAWRNAAQRDDKARFKTSPRTETVLYNAVDTRIKHSLVRKTSPALQPERNGLARAAQTANKRRASTLAKTSPARQSRA